MGAIRDDRLEVVAPALGEVGRHELLPLEMVSGFIARDRFSRRSREIPRLRVALTVSRLDRRVHSFGGRFK